MVCTTASRFFYKPADHLSIRLHYGSGYKIPGLFNVAQPQEYVGLAAITSSVKSELSNGLNMDVNYSTLVLGELVVQVNQALYWTTIANPTMLRTDANGNVFVENGEYTLTSLGTDTYVRLQLDEWELYLGYNHTIAQQVGSGMTYNTPFNPQDKLAATLAFEVESKWRMGVEAAYNANQFIYGNVRVPNFWFLAGMVERKFKCGSIVLNCENIGDYRQSNEEPLVPGTTQNPIFTSLWGPVEGRVMNLSLKIAL